MMQLAKKKEKEHRNIIITDPEAKERLIKLLGLTENTTNIFFWYSLEQKENNFFGIVAKRANKYEHSWKSKWSYDTCLDQLVPCSDYDDHICTIDVESKF
jgi:hypothetical protein